MFQLDQSPIQKALQIRSGRQEVVGKILADFTFGDFRQLAKTTHHAGCRDIRFNLAIERHVGNPTRQGLRQAVGLGGVVGRTEVRPLCDAVPLDVRGGVVAAGRVAGMGIGTVSGPGGAVVAAETTCTCPSRNDSDIFIAVSAL